MKIKVADLEPNPFRKIKEYPIDREKVGELKTSITEKRFWGSLPVREHNGKYELACGHHRWYALKELGIEFVEVTIEKYNDGEMIQVMAEENLDWSTSPIVMTQTIIVAKEFLDTEIAKNETLEDFGQCGPWAILIFVNEQGYQKAKSTENGVGRRSLSKFLGGNWTQKRVRGALEIIKDKDISDKAIRILPTMREAKVFHKSIKLHDTSKPNQEKIAKAIVKDGIGIRDIPELVAKFSPPIPNLKAPKKRKHKSLPNVVEYIFKLESDTFDINRRLKALRPEMVELAGRGRLLGRLIPALIQLNGTISEIKDDYEKARKETKKVASV